MVLSSKFVIQQGYIAQYAIILSCTRTIHEQSFTVATSGMTHSAQSIGAGCAKVEMTSTGCLCSQAALIARSTSTTWAACSPVIRWGRGSAMASAMSSRLRHHSVPLYGGAQCAVASVPYVLEHLGCALFPEKKAESTCLRSFPDQTPFVFSIEATLSQETAIAQHFDYADALLCSQL